MMTIIDDILSQPTLEYGKKDDIYQYDDNFTSIFMVTIVNKPRNSNVWHFSDGTVNFYALIEDNDFLTKYSAKKRSFFKEYLLKVRVRKKQYYNITCKFLDTTYFIEEIIFLHKFNLSHSIENN